eukprot:CCRYP_009145-RA/>CCRYP_009145-RA protein AED:0.43 eAED:0.43 QI:0/0/0/1/0/0/2/0/153
MDGYTLKSLEECMAYYTPDHSAMICPKGCYQSKILPELWKHKARPIHFVLVVDDFGIKYIKKADIDLVQTLEKYYDVTVNLDRKEYVKIELDCDYKNKRVCLSMEPYLQKSLHYFDKLSPPNVMICSTLTLNQSMEPSKNLPNMIPVYLSEQK